MTTAAEIITDAYLTLRSNDPGEPLEEFDFAQGLRWLNRMLTRWEANGVSLGWSNVTLPTDVVPIPPEAEEAVINNLALKLRKNTGSTLDPDLVEEARDGYRALQRDVYAAGPPVQITTAPIPSNGVAGVRWNINSDSPY